MTSAWVSCDFSHEHTACGCLHCNPSVALPLLHHAALVVSDVMCSVVQMEGAKITRLTMHSRKDQKHSIKRKVLIIEDKLQDTLFATQAQMSTRRPVVWQPNKFPLPEISSGAFTPMGGKPRYYPHLHIDA